MNQFPFRIKVEGAAQAATLRFATQTELGRYHRSLSPFYEKLMAVSPIQDLFIIEAREMAAITDRQEKMSRPRLVTKPADGLK